MINSLAYQVNQWSLWRRCILLVLFVVIIFTAWYFFLEKPLLTRYEEVFVQQAKEKTLENQLQLFEAEKSNFIYKNHLQLSQPRSFLQNGLANIAGLSITTYTNNPSVDLPNAGTKISNLSALLNIVLSSVLTQSPVTVVFSGKFKDVVNYLKVLENTPNGIYFERIDFNMNRYPKAEITMKIFTLQG